MFGSLIHRKKVINILLPVLPYGKNINNDTWNTPGKVLQWYICALTEFHIFLSHINTTSISGVIARDDIFSSDLTISQVTTLVEKMTSNQGWSEEHLQPRKISGGMHVVKEVDMLSAKMDLLMKRLEDWANEKQDVMHIHDFCMTCEECENTKHSGNNCPKT